ncbi:MAG TPA: two-component regulator propeller domain-containing protein [Marinagarivorans sp.]
MAETQATRVKHRSNDAHIMRITRLLTPLLDKIVINLTFLLLCLIILFYHHHALGTEPKTAPHHKEHLSFSHILPNEVEGLGYINALAMDRQGFIWLASNNGLARFDGYQLVTFKHAPGASNGLPSNLVNDLIVDSTGRMWAATQAGLSLFNPHNNTFKHYTVEPKYGVGDEFNTLRSLHEDNDGQIWLGSAAGLLRFDDQKQQLIPLSLSLPPGHISSQLSIADISSDVQNNLWLATASHGLVKVSRFTLQAQYNLAQTALLASKNHADVRSVMVDNSGLIWAGTYQGDLVAINRQGHVQHHYSQPPEERRDVIWSIIQDKQGRIWVGDGGGINLLSDEGPWLIRYSYDDSNRSSPGNYAVRTVFEDDIGDLWLGFFPSGVDRLDRQASAFQNYRYNSQDDNSLSDGGVLSVVEDEQQNLWIGTGFGLSYFDRKRQTFKRTLHDDEDPYSISGNTALSLALTGPDQLWVGSWSQGLNRLNLSTGKAMRFSYNPTDKNSLLGVEPWQLLNDSNGDFWVATELGLSRYRPSTQQFERIQPINAITGKPYAIYLRSLFEDHLGNFWLGSDRGLFLYDRTNNSWQLFENNKSDRNSLSANFVKCIYEDSLKQLWIGTHGGGLNVMDRQTGTFETVGQDQALDKLVISGITEDHQGALWLNTLSGLYKMELASRKFTRFTTRHGLISNVFNRNAITTLKNGDIFAGSAGGFTLITPDKIAKNLTSPRTVITEFSIFNKTIDAYDEHSPLSQTINYTEEIRLKHHQSVISFQFSALSYQLSEQNQYAYMLEGFDKQWHEVGHRRTATYTNLDAGRYTFKVKSANHDGVWSEQPTQLALTILPPPWLTWWAYCVYGLCVLGLGVFAFHIQSRKVQLQHEKTLNNKLLKLDKFKDAFLASTSHELRTPLNGIIGIAENLVDSKARSLDEDTITKLTMISHSGKRLASLVNDILDYSKLSEQSLKVHMCTVSTADAVSQVDALLRPLAEAKGIELINTINANTPAVLADENRLQQILLNLIGNAIKYTNHGYVKLTTKIDSNEVRIIIADSGIGIASDDINHIFEVFHQVEHDDDQFYPGTGLGLAIAKQLIELQGGRIIVASERNKGSMFAFTLQRADNSRTSAQHRADHVHYKKRVNCKDGEPTGEKPAAQLNRQPHLEHAAIATTAAKPAAPASGKTHPKERDNARPKALPRQCRAVPCLHGTPHTRTILIVDDDAINRIVLTGILQLHNYKVAEANGGRAALDYLNNAGRADMVIMDVMMPEMNGFELCRHLREQYTMVQLPIIFLSAKLTDDDLCKGYSAGANNFLTKPVSKFELLPQVAALLTLCDGAKRYKH